MLYVFYGTDVTKARNALHKTVEGLLSKKEDASLVQVEGTRSWGDDELEGYIKGQGLFEKKLIVTLDGVCKTEEVRDKITDALPALSESPNVFLLIEEKVTPSFLKKIEKYAEKVLAFEKPEEKQTFNIFALTDALGKRDKKTLWVLYQKAKLAGIEDEHMHATLLWQVRSMLLARASKDAKEAGLAPFVFTKASQYAKNYPGKELEKLSASLVEVLHDARRGASDFAVGLEKLLLSV